MTRVLHVVEAIETGVIRHVVDVVEHVAAEHHVALPARRVGGMTDERAIARLGAVAELHRVAMHRSATSPTNLAAVRHVRRLIGALRPDVVHGHSTVGGTVTRLATTASAVPCVYTPNGLSPRLAARVAERVLRPATTRLVAVSDSEADLAVARGVVGRDRCAVIPNGIDPSPPPPTEPGLAERLGLPPGTTIVGTAGRLSAQKAPEVLIDAWGRAARDRSDVHFVWMGDGEDRAGAEDAAAATGVAERVHLLGHVDRAAGLMHELAVFTLGSRFEGGPYAPLEAMRVGVPVLATDVVGTRDCIDHGRTGVLVPPDDPAALAVALGALLDDADDRRRLGEAGRAAVQDRFSVHRMADRLRALYDEVASA